MKTHTSLRCIVPEWDMACFSCLQLFLWFVNAKAVLNTSILTLWFSCLFSYNSKSYSFLNPNLLVIKKSICTVGSGNILKLLKWWQCRKGTHQVLVSSSSSAHSRCSSQVLGVEDDTRIVAWENLSRFKNN